MQNTIEIPLTSLIFTKNVRDKSSKRHFQLEASMKKDGQLVPIIVKPRADGKYLVVAGNRRSTSASNIGWTKIKAIPLSQEANAETCFRIQVIENTVRKNLDTFEKYQAIHEYCRICDYPLNKQGLTKAGFDLGLEQSEISKCINANLRLTQDNRAKLLGAKVASSIIYLVSQETGVLQDELTNDVIDKKMTRSQVQQYFRDKRKGIVRFDFRQAKAELALTLKKGATRNDVDDLVKAFFAELRKNSGFDLATAARRIKEQVDVLAQKAG